MKVTIFGATGGLGSECLEQALEAKHDVTVLVRTPSKLPAHLYERITVVQGDALNADDVAQVLGSDTQGILFAVGVDRNSPEDLCTDVTRNVLAVLRRHHGVGRFIWCGGGSTFVEDDVVTFGAKFVRWFARTFLGFRQRDKEHQLALLEESLDVEWVGIRPLRMRKGPRRESYRLGFYPYSGLSSISFADCAHAMVALLDDEGWLHKAPIVQY